MSGVSITAAEIALALPPSPEDWQDLRERHGLTQQALADLVYRSVTSIQKWEQGRGAGDRACWHLALLRLRDVPLDE